MCSCHDCGSVSDWYHEEKQIGMVAGLIYQSEGKNRCFKTPKESGLPCETGGYRNHLCYKIRTSFDILLQV
ncbi:hypothetical protein V6Z11_D08G120000 [Gossypium hirsutum]